jgi:hypothetical protein
VLLCFPWFTGRRGKGKEKAGGGKKKEEKKESNTICESDRRDMHV